MTEYRSMRPDEWAEGLELWHQVFGVGKWLFQTLHESSPRRKWDHTRVAVVDGRIVSAIDVFLRPIRDSEGKTVWVGGIGSVATLPEGRKQGHSRTLLKQAIEQMEIEQCGWSFLFTGTQSHYSKLGWEEQLQVGIRGVVQKPEVSADYFVSALGTSDPFPLGSMATLHESFNANRPLTTVRDSNMWSIAIRARMERAERHVLGAYDGQELVGYLVGSFGEQRATVEELCVSKGHPQAVGNLLSGFVDRMHLAGLMEAEWVLPGDPVLDPWLPKLLTQCESFERGGAMTRPIASDFQGQVLPNLFSLANATHYGLDSF